MHGPRDMHAVHATSPDDPPTMAERDDLPDRRENQWTKPSVVVALVGLLFQALSMFFLVGGGLLVFYATSQSDKVSTDMTNAQVVGAIQKLEMKIDSAVSASQQANNTNTTQEGNINTLMRDVAEANSKIADLIKTVEANEKAQRDYNFNLSRDLTRAQEALKR